MENHGGEATSLLAVRKLLDAELRSKTGWPRAQDYEQIAADLERSGQPGPAELARQAAQADDVLAAASARWAGRYANRPYAASEEEVAQLWEREDTALDPAGPYPGIDGAAYRPGVLNSDLDGEPVLFVTGHGTAEAITGWERYADMMRWIESRGSTGSGALVPPPVPRGRDTRTWREDAVLARLTGCTWEEAVRLA
jgi:hypothetical protein